MTDQPKLSIIIPIHNEERLLEEVLRHVRAIDYANKELILVDDASTDRTAQILKSEAIKPDTRVLTHPKNRGKGAAIRTGLEIADGDIVIIQDADMEYDPNDIVRVLEPILKGRTRVAYGSRFMGEVKQMRLPNRVANWLLAWMVSLLYGQRITDEATAYKAFTREVIKSIDLECERFEFCPEVTAKVLRMGHRIEEVPVVFTARTVIEGKKIGWRDFIVAVRVLVKWRLRKEIGRKDEKDNRDIRD